MADHKKILLVDDDHFILTLLTGMLAEEGYETTQADSGEAALQLLREGAFDLVITDIFMPGKNGIELASYVKSHYADVPVLAISSNFDAARSADALGLTSYFADDSLSKPIKKEDLITSVQTLLSNTSAMTLYG